MPQRSRDREIINLIESYRKLYWLFENNEFVENNKYSAQVVFYNQKPYNAPDNYHVALNDTWINTQRPGSMLIFREMVADSNFSGKSLTESLDKLLIFTKSFL